MSSRESTDDPFGEPVNLGPTINGNVFDHDPALSADALTLVFSSNRAGGLGTKALWMSTRSSKDDPWSTPVNLGSQINGQDQETGACLSADGLTLLFNSAVSQGGKCSLLRSTRSAKDRP